MTDRKTYQPTSAERVAYTIGEAAAILGVSRGHLYHLIDRGELRRVKLGRRALISAAEIRRLLGETSDGNGAA